MAASHQGGRPLSNESRNLATAAAASLGLVKRTGSSARALLTSRFTVTVMIRPQDSRSIRIMHTEVLDLLWAMGTALTRCVTPASRGP